MKNNRLEVTNDGIRFRRVYLNGDVIGELIYSRERKRWEMWELPIDQPNPYTKTIGRAWRILLIIMTRN